MLETKNDENGSVVKLLEIYSCVQTKNYYGFTLGNQIIVNFSYILKKASHEKLIVIISNFEQECLIREREQSLVVCFYL